MGIATIEQIGHRVYSSLMTSTRPLSPFLLGASIVLGLSLRRWRRVSGAGGQKRYQEH